MVEIEFTSRVPLTKPVELRLVEAVRRVLSGAGTESAEISLAVVDDATIHELNRRHLDHDYPTDVLSFCFGDTVQLTSQPNHLEGEIIVSWDRACDVAPQFAWSPEDELLLYVIHGALHLVGHDDHDPRDRERMRQAEAEHLRSFGLMTPQRSSIGSVGSASFRATTPDASLRSSDFRGGS